jgi:diketogulonate reductase-like aldo/keto reductase
MFEELKDEGVLKSIGVSNFRPQDLKAVLEIAKYKPVVNQLEYQSVLSRRHSLSLMLLSAPTF